MGSILGLGRSPGEGDVNSSITALTIPQTEDVLSYSAWGHKRTGRDLATKQQSSES